MLTGLLRIEDRVVNIDLPNGRSFYQSTEGRGPWVEMQHVNDMVWRGFYHLEMPPSVVPVFTLDIRRGTIVFLPRPDFSPGQRAGAVQAAERRFGSAAPKGSLALDEG